LVGVGRQLVAGSWQGCLFGWLMWDGGWQLAGLVVWLVDVRRQLAAGRAEWLVGWLVWVGSWQGSLVGWCGLAAGTWHGWLGRIQENPPTF